MAVRQGLKVRKRLGDGAGFDSGNKSPDFAGSSLMRRWLDTTTSIEPPTSSQLLLRHAVGEIGKGLGRASAEASRLLNSQAVFLYEMTEPALSVLRS